MTCKHRPPKSLGPWGPPPYWSGWAGLAAGAGQSARLFPSRANVIVSGPPPPPPPCSDLPEPRPQHLQRGAGAPGGRCPPNHKGLGDAGLRGAQGQPSSYTPTLPTHSLVLRPEPSAWVNVLVQLMFAEHLCGSRHQACCYRFGVGRDGVSATWGRCECPELP